MDILIPDIINVAEDVLKVKVTGIEAVKDPTVNRLYKVRTHDGAYIFKIFRQKTWPEDGKLEFIDRKLGDRGISCAKLIAFSRGDARFPNGFAIQHLTGGQNAKDIAFCLEDGVTFYKKLGLLISEIHKIKLENYGYIGSGVALYEKLEDYIGDVCDDNIAVLTGNRRIDDGEAAEIKGRILETLWHFKEMPAVLCHGDISTKNIIVGADGRLILIDWDDAIANIWPADFARMTYWMRFHYNIMEYHAYREAFLEGYVPDCRVRNLDALEYALHLFYGLDFMAFDPDSRDFENRLRYLREIMEHT